MVPDVTGTAQLVTHGEDWLGRRRGGRAHVLKREVTWFYLMTQVITQFSRFYSEQVIITSVRKSNLLLLLYVVSSGPHTPLAGASFAMPGHPDAIVTVAPLVLPGICASNPLPSLPKCCPLCSYTLLKENSL